ncbi:MAG: addiction module protein [Desulfovermiculus sp.]|nr:addiction module protein [Desulfovermiculus sp.]
MLKWHLIRYEDLVVEKMSVSERIQAMEVLWDSLIRHDAEIDSPQWHYDLLAQRKMKIDSGEAELISLAD